VSEADNKPTVKRCKTGGTIKLLLIWIVLATTVAYYFGIRPMLVSLREAKAELAESELKDKATKFVEPMPTLSSFRIMRGVQSGMYVVEQKIFREDGSSWWIRHIKSDYTTYDQAKTDISELYLPCAVALWQRKNDTFEQATGGAE